MSATSELYEDVASLRKAIQLINTLTQELDIHAAMESVRHVALELLECERVTLFLIIEPRNELRGNTGPADDGRSITVKFGEGVAGVVAQNGGLMNIPDAYSHPLFNPDVDRHTHYHTKNILCTAIKDMSGKNIAVLQALNKNSGPFTSIDEEHIQLFGVHLGNTLSKSRFFEEAKREKERLVTLSMCFKRLNGVTSLAGALDTIAAAVKQLVCAQHVVVLLMDHARQVLWTRISSSHGSNASKLFRVQQGEGIISNCAATKEQLVQCFLPDQDVDSTLLQLHRVLTGHSSGLSAVLLQPVLEAVSNSVMGMVCVLNKADPSDRRDIFFEPTFTPSDCEALNVFGMEVADVLAARAVEVSFASALSVVTSAQSSTDDGVGSANSSGNGSGSGSGPSGGGSGSCSANTTKAAGQQTARSQQTRARSTPPEQLSNMLKAQLLDYAPAGLASEERASSGAGQHLLHHSHTINVATGCDGGGSGRDALDAVLEGVFQESHSEHSLLRFSSMSAASRAASGTVLGSLGSGTLGSCRLGSGPLTPSCRSFHHMVPETIAIQSAASHSRRFELSTWDLDCTAMSKEQLVHLAFDIFVLSGVLDELGIPESELSGFLSGLSAHYHSPEDVPYHNLAHVVQVLHTVWLLLECTNARAVLSAEEELVLLIAAICHDMDHDGFTNTFHIYSQSPLAQRYNDKSVQENHHCALTFAVLSKRGSNLLCRFTSREEFFAARKLLIDAILATDMHHHFALTQELMSHSTVFQAQEDADRALLVKALLHAADISNHIRPFPVALAHAERVQQEFRRQVAREHALGLPISPHMDAPEQTWYKMEVQFIDYVAGPLWERLGQIFPTLQEPLQNMRANRAKFAALAQSCLDLAAEGSQAAAGAPTGPPDPGGCAEERSSGASSTSSSSSSSFSNSAARPWWPRSTTTEAATNAVEGVPLPAGLLDGPSRCS